MSGKVGASPQYAAVKAALADIEKRLADRNRQLYPGREMKALEQAAEEAKKALGALVEVRNELKVKKADKVEEKLAKTLEQATAELEKMKGAVKLVAEKSRKTLTAVVATASELTGDRAVMQATLDAGVDAGLDEKELADAREKLSAIISFQLELTEGIESLRNLSEGGAWDINVPKLEGAIAATKAPGGAYNTLQRLEVEEWMKVLIKPEPMAVATDEMEKALNTALALGMDEAVLKPLRKKNDDAKTTQNAYKAERKRANKPQSEPPAPPARPEPHADVAKMKADLEALLEAAAVKLAEAKATYAMKVAVEGIDPAELLDLGVRPLTEMPPVLLMLKEALVTAQAASADPEKLAKAQKAYEDAIVQRKEARQDLAKERLAGACTTPPSDCDMAALSAAITVAEEEGIEEQLILDAKAHEFVCRKTQSEDKLLPLAQPQLLTHDGFGIIEDLKLALEEANRCGGQEDLRIKAQAKLDFWLEARTRRDDALKALTTAMKVPTLMIDVAKVNEILIECIEARVDPTIIEESEKRIASLGKSAGLFAKAEKPPGLLNIPELMAELADVGGEEQMFQQQRQEELEVRVGALKAKIELIKETMEQQKKRDAFLKKQVTKRAHHQKPEDRSKTGELLPAWVRTDTITEREIEHEIPRPPAAQQEIELRALEQELIGAQEALKAQVAVIKAIALDATVPQDLVAFAQKKLAIATVADRMQTLCEPAISPLEIDCAALEAAIRKCEEKHAAMTIFGMGELDVNVPDEVLATAKARLAAATKAQSKQSKSREALTARVNAPTGTATFDTLVKLVAEAKENCVEEALILRAELKLKKMEDLAAASLRAGPLAFISFHFPCLRPLLVPCAISMIEQAEVKRLEMASRQEAARKELIELVGSWHYGIFDSSLESTDEVALKSALKVGFEVGLPQEDLELARIKVQVMDKYKRDKTIGLIQDASAEGSAAMASKDGQKISKRV